MDEVSTTLVDFDKLWDYSKPAETEAKFRELLPQAMTSCDREYLLELQTQIARKQGLQRKFEDAHSTLDGVAATLMDSQPTRASVRYHLERGRVHNSNGKKQEATSEFERALAQAEQLSEDNFAVDAAHMLGIATSGDTALAWNERAVQMAEASDDPKTKNWLGALYNNIGWTYHDLGKYDVALGYFERNLDWYQERKSEKQSRIARWSIAKMHRLLGDATQAFEEQKTLQAEIAAVGADEDGYVYEELGECAIALDRDESEWKPYIQRAFDLLSKDPWSVSQEPKKHERLKQLLGID